jgi:hypothetical protein
VDGGLGLSRRVVLDRRGRRCRLVLVSRRAVLGNSSWWRW